MMGHVIHIYGASGSGTSTLGRALAQRLGYRWMDTDDYYWLPTEPPFTTKRPAQERLTLMRADCERLGDVVITGSLVDWGDPLMPLFTLAIRLETPTDVRLSRIRKRERERFGARLDPGGDMHEGHKAFLAWSAGYDTGGLNMRSRVKHDQWEKGLTCPRITLDGREMPERNVEILLERELV